MSAFIDAHRERLGVEPICRELEVSASAYRARRTSPPSARSLRDAFLLEEIRRVHADSGGVYGQLKTWDELNETGVGVARCTVERLMRAHGIRGVGPARTTQTTLPGERPMAAPDLVRRDFTATRPDELWLVDFTYARPWGGWSYLAVVLDVYTRGASSAGSSPAICARASSATPSRWPSRHACSTRTASLRTQTMAHSTPPTSTPNA